MKNIKFKGILVSGLLSLAALTGCGEGTSNVDESNVISFWHTFSKSTQTIIERRATEFEKYIKERDGVDIEIKQDSQGDYDALAGKIIKGYAVGTTPTITVAYPDNIAYYFGLESNPGDFVVKLDDFFNDEKLGFAADEFLNPNSLGTDDFVASFIDEGRHYKYEGTYSMPFMKSSEIMLYNAEIVEDVLSKLGISEVYERYMENITWDELMELCEYIKDHADDYLDTSANKAYPLYYDSDANFFITQCYQRDIPYISMSEDGKGSIDFNNPKAVELINEFKGLHDDKILTTKGVENKYGSDFFKSLQCAFTVGSTGGSGYSDPGVSFEVGVCKFPTYKGVSEERAKYVSQGVTLALLNNQKDTAEVNDKKVKYGWEFVKYLLNTENNTDICLSSQGYVPVRESCYEDPMFTEFMANEDDYMVKVFDAVVNDINGNYYNFPVFEGSDQARTQVEGAVKNTLLGNGTAASNLEVAEVETLKFVK